MPEIAFTAADWIRINETYTAWWEGRLERPIVYLGNVTETGRFKRAPGWYGFLNNYGDEVSPAEIVEKFVEQESERVYVGDAYPQWFVNFGAGVLADALGAETTVTEETVWFSPPEGADLAGLEINFDRESYWWRRIVDVTRTAVDMIGDVVQVSYTDLGGNLDILASLIGSEQLCLEVIDRPELVDKAVAAITRAWLEAFDELDAIIRPTSPGSQAWAQVWAPGSSYMLQCDFSYMISPKMFGRFVMPDLEACCRHMEYPFYHLDGVGEIPHLDQLISIEDLRGIQWIPGDGKPAVHDWTDFLRRIREGGKLVQIFTSCQGARKVCREIDGGKGFLLSVGDEMTPDEATAYLEELETLYR